MLNSIKGGSWLACDGINPVYLIHRGACIAGKPAPTERQSSAALADERGQTVGAGLPAKAAGQPTDMSLTHRPRRQASSHRKAKAVRWWRSVLGQTVGAGLPAKAAGLPTDTSLTHRPRRQASSHS